VTEIVQGFGYMAAVIVSMALATYVTRRSSRAMTGMAIGMVYAVYLELVPPYVPAVWGDGGRLALFFFGQLVALAIGLFLTMLYLARDRR
jgi:hypothetical protein